MKLTFCTSEIVFNIQHLLQKSLMSKIIFQTFPQSTFTLLQAPQNVLKSFPSSSTSQRASDTIFTFFSMDLLYIYQYLTNVLLWVTDTDIGAVQIPQKFIDWRKPSQMSWISTTLPISMKAFIKFYKFSRQTITLFQWLWSTYRPFALAGILSHAHDCTEDSMKSPNIFCSHWHIDITAGKLKLEKETWGSIYKCFRANQVTQNYFN